MAFRLTSGPTISAQGSLGSNRKIESEKAVRESISPAAKLSGPELYWALTWEEEVIQGIRGQLDFHRPRMAFHFGCTKERNRELFTF